MKLQIFCTRKEMITKLKRTFTEWKKIFVSLYIRHLTDNQKMHTAQRTKLPKNQ
jgi:hypothetical protein